MECVMRRVMLGLGVVAVALGSGYVGAKLGSQSQFNALCCQIDPTSRRLVVSAKEKLGLAIFYADNGQDKWVSEAVFPGVKNGFFLDVGSGDGTYISATKALEQKGWTGLCIDPFPRNMQDRSCQIVKEVVSNEAGQQVKFWRGKDWGGIEDTLGTEAKAVIHEAPFVELNTVTLGDILERAKAPRFINFVSMDIEGGELNALKGFPFDKYQMGALAVEHNYEEPKRSEIKELMKSHGYTRVHIWNHDDFYLPADRALHTSQRIR
jgi:FkbM family methyltransferase